MTKSVSQVIEFGIQQKGKHPNWKMSQFEYNIDARYTTIKQAKEELEKARKGFPYLNFRIIKITEIQEVIK